MMKSKRVKAERGGGGVEVKRREKETRRRREGVGSCDPCLIIL